VEHEFIHLDAAVVKVELRRLYRYVRENYASFEDVDEETDARKFNLAKVFEFVSTSFAVGSTMKTSVEIIDFIMAYAFGSCEVSVFAFSPHTTPPPHPHPHPPPPTTTTTTTTDDDTTHNATQVERIGRLMNLTKNNLRTDLGDERFFALCFIKHVMPSLDAIDWEPLLKMWYEDGHHDAKSLQVFPPSSKLRK